MKKIKNTVTLIRDVITILGIPAIGVLGWNMHQEQLKMKDFTIDTMQAQIDFLEKQQNPTLIDNLEITNRYFTKEHKKLKDSILNLRNIIFKGDTLTSVNHGHTYLKVLNNLLFKEQQLCFAYENSLAVKKGYDIIPPLLAYSIRLKNLINVYYGENNTSKKNGIKEYLESPSQHLYDIKEYEAAAESSGENPEERLEEEIQYKEIKEASIDIDKED